VSGRMHCPKIISFLTKPWRHWDCDKLCADIADMKCRCRWSHSQLSQHYFVYEFV
jgi:hypothetical protein